MPQFPRAITDFWNAWLSTGELLHRDASFEIRINPSLPAQSQIMLLAGTDGSTRAALTPPMAERAGLGRQEVLSAPSFRRTLADAGLALCGADDVFYYAETAKQALGQESPARVRRLDERDREAFTVFQASASEQDLEGAYVELDHWAVYGAFDHDRLVCAASMYPWHGAAIADTGVLTLVAFRGQGHARDVVRAISRHAWAQGHEPQYRCQTDNLASVSLAKAAGLAWFGTWEVISGDARADA
jgi:hypothetical protein